MTQLLDFLSYTMRKTSINFFFSWMSYKFQEISSFFRMFSESSVDMFLALTRNTRLSKSILICAVLSKHGPQILLPLRYVVCVSFP